MDNTKSKKELGIVTPPQDKSKLAYHHRDKSTNDPEFNKKVKKRRAKAKHDAINRKKNRRK